MYANYRGLRTTLACVEVFVVFTYKTVREGKEEEVSTPGSRCVSALLLKSLQSDGARMSQQ